MKPSLRNDSPFLNLHPAQKMTTASRQVHVRMIRVVFQWSWSIDCDGSMNLRFLGETHDCKPSHYFGDNKLGKVRTETVKRAARELIEKFPDKFTNEFEANKTAVNETVRAPSKKLRNLIAGYVTRLRVTATNKAAMLQMSPEAQLGLGEDEEEPTQEESTPATA